MISKKLLLMFTALGLITTSACAAYPERDIQGIIMWGAGGAMDVVARAIGPHVEQQLGKKIIMINKPGGTGAISTNTVVNAPADGYTLLFGAENPQLHKVLGLAKFDYDKFTPISILGRGVGVVVVRADAPWKTFTELVDDIKKNPGKLKMAMTGPGGAPHTIASMMNAVIPGLKTVSVPFDGEGPVLTAIMGGHADFSPVGVSAAAEAIKAGRVRALTVIDLEPIGSLPDIPSVVKEFPGFSKYLPWGAFFGVFVKKETPDDIKAVLTKAFKTAGDNPQFQKLMVDRGNLVMNISGDEAETFVKRWQSITSWLLQEVGAAKISPEEFGIPKP